MLTAHTVEQIRAAERSLAERTGWDALMQRAAQGLADALDDIPAGEVVIVLVGPGNNGGDALFAAAHLLDRGVRVDLCLLDAERAHPAGLAAAQAAGAQVVEAPTRQRYCIDALFGIGARPGLEGRAVEWADWIAEQRPWTVAVDVPSGLDVDGATASGAHVVADLTVTFGTYKPALLIDPAASACGEVVLVDIGLDPYLDDPVLRVVEPLDADLLLAALPDASSHKYSRGVLGVRAGSAQYAGAAHLCIAGAQAGLTGMIRFVGDDDLATRVVDRAPEVVAGAGRVQAWVVGPGGGGAAASALREVVQDGVPVVVDASALDHLPESFDVPAVLTPHAGELARMLGTDRESVEARPWEHARRAAEQWGATVLLKGPRTLVVRPDGGTSVNLSGTPWLGTAGAGDVLAGFIGSLLAAGLEPFDAGSLGAFLHGAAAVAANPGGPITASDVAATLPGVVADFLAGDLLDVRREDWA